MGVGSAENKHQNRRTRAENRARCTRYRLGVETVGAGHLEGPWGEEKVVVMVVVMLGAGDWAGAGVLPCQTENQVQRTRYQSGVEAIGVGRLEGLWGEEEVVVVVMGCQEWEIGRGQGFCPAKPKTECNALGIEQVWRLLVWVV